MNTDHTRFMQRALRLAARGRLTVSPNPMVGCLVVKEGTIVGQGYHQRAGCAHAESIALKAAGIKARGATVYLTLEPCSHFGRTAPCVNALIEAGVQQVYVACVDPNPQVNGQGIAALRKAGIRVEVGLLEAKARQLNEIFFYYMKYKKPFVIAKWAMSLDGKTQVQPTDLKQISGLAAQQHTHRLRQQVDTILIGAETARQDNPQLTARTIQKSGWMKQPRRVIVCGKKNLPANLNIFRSDLEAHTILITTPSEYHRFKHLTSPSVLLLTVASVDDQVPLDTMLYTLGEQGISSLLVEGGMKTHAQFFKAGLVNKIHVYLSPVIIGTQVVKQPFSTLKMQKRGCDFHFTN